MIDAKEFCRVFARKQIYQLQTYTSIIRRFKANRNDLLNWIGNIDPFYIRIFLTAQKPLPADVLVRHLDGGLLEMKTALRECRFYS